MLEWLAAQPSVRWLAPKKLVRLHNLAAGAAVQSGGLGRNQDPSDASLHPFWQVQSWGDGAGGAGGAAEPRSQELCHSQVLHSRMLLPLCGRRWACSAASSG